MEDQNTPAETDHALTPQEVIELLIEDPADLSVYEEILTANMDRPEILKVLLEYPATPEDIRKKIADRLNVPLPPVKPLVIPEEVKEARRESLTTKIQKLTVSARVQLAIKGGREIRGILSRDSNKLVMLAVLDNGKITESEIELIAKSRSVLEDTLRKISKNREWMKNYSILLAIVTNPKTPPGIAVTHVSDLKIKDIIMLEKNKNLAEAVRGAAKRIIQARKPK